MQFPRIRMIASAEGVKEREADPVVLWRRYIEHHTVEDRNALVECYMPIVRHQAERLAARLPKYVEADDLAQEGIFGLVHSIESFDLERRVPFEKFCLLRIRGAMIDVLRRTDTVSRVTRRKEKQIRAIRSQLASQLQRKPNEVDVIEALPMNRDTAVALIQDAQASKTSSLHLERNDIDSAKPIATIHLLSDEFVTQPDESILSREGFDALLAELDDSEKVIITSYYQEQKTMTEIGHGLHKSEGWISKEHKRIKNKLRRKIGAHRGEEDYLGATFEVMSLPPYRRKQAQGQHIDFQSAQYGHRIRGVFARPGRKSLAE